jgi:hypothetical protein
MSEVTHAKTTRRNALSICALWSALLVLSLGIPAANATACVISGPQYQLQSDTVEWQLNIRNGQSCLRGIGYKSVARPVIKIIFPPRIGNLAVQGPSFTYTAGTNRDSFSIEVSGFANGGNGTSTIRVVVSIIGEPPQQQAPVSPDRAPPAAAQSVDLLPVPSVDNNRGPEGRVGW